MEMEEINKILEKVLLEFPIKEININLPQWIEGLPKNHWVKNTILSSIKEIVHNLQRLSEINYAVSRFGELDIINAVKIKGIELGEGVANIEMNVDGQLFYHILNELTGYRIEGEHQLLGLVTGLAKAKKEFDKVERALSDARLTGYGLVPPSLEELDLAEPEIFKQGNRFGVKLKAMAPSLHFIRADLTTEVSPIIGTEKQSEELVKYLLDEFESDPSKIWESNMFGKSLHDLVKEQLESKLNMMPEDARSKMQRTLERIVNDASGGLICIII